MFTRSVSIEAMASKEVISISVSIFRIYRVEIELLADLREDLVEAFLAQLEPVDLLRELANHVPRQPATELLQAVHDLLFARGEGRGFHGNREGGLGLCLGGLRGGFPPARSRLRLLFLRSGLRLGWQRRTKLLQDLLRLLLREELRESFDLGGREFLEREACVREDHRGLLRDPAVAKRLDRRRSGHPHSSDGGSSSSTSTSSSEISTYMSFSVRP